MTSSASRKARAAQEKAARQLAREEIVLEFKYAPGALGYHGPIINTGLTINAAHREALMQAGQTIPPPVTCRFLIDTGSDGCVVKHEFAVRAGLKLINDNYPLRGVGIDTTGKAYMGRILFGQPSRIIAGAMHSMFVDTQVVSGNLEGDLFDGLIGRDVLSHFQLSYDGKTGIVRMKWHRPEVSGTP
jgi:Aspartyl protease